MLDGFMDDIHGIEKRVRIRPLHTDSDIVYYWHTNMYIGKEIYRPAETMNIDISASGGSDDSKYFMNVSYLSQDAVVKWAGYDRITVRGNSQFKVLKNVILGTNLSAQYSKYMGGDTNENATWQAPIIPVRDVMGNWAGSKANGLGDIGNPVATLFNARNNYRNNLNLLGNVFLEINFLNAFQFKSTAGANLTNTDRKSFSPVTFWNKGDKNTLVNSLLEIRNQRMELVWNNTLTYTKNFMDSHNIVVLLGSEAVAHSYDELQASRTGFLVEDMISYYRERKIRSAFNLLLHPVGARFRPRASYPDRLNLSR